MSKVKGGPARELVRVFSEKLLGRYPSVVALPSQNREVFLYGWKLGLEGTIFVALVLDLRDRAFTVEVGWSARDRFPIDPDQVRTKPWLDPAPVRGALLFRIGSFLSKPRPDLWWSLATGEVLARGEPVVEEGDPGARVLIAIDTALDALEVAFDYIFRRMRIPRVPGVGRF